jgi:hypothetical protein
VSGDTAVRAAHSLSAHPGVDQVVVIGQARSQNFKVVATAEACDFLVGAGASAPETARRHGVPLLWNGEQAEDGVAVWGASPLGITLAIAAGEPDPQLVALADPIRREADSARVRFPDPVGAVGVSDSVVAGHRIALGKAPGDYSACLVVGSERKVTIVDHGAFLAGVALAAAIGVAGKEPAPVWDRPLGYLNTATAMGLVMGEA